MGTIEPKLLEAEGIRSQGRSADDIGAWDMLMEANSLFWRVTKADSEAAIALMRRAVERYPDYAPAHSMLAFMLVWASYLVFIEPQTKEAARLATHAAVLTIVIHGRISHLASWPSKGAALKKRRRNTGAPST